MRRALKNIPAKYIISALLVLLGNTVCVRAQDYAWLHVEGKYIRTSPSAGNPNQIWMGCGPAWNNARWDVNPPWNYAGDSASAVQWMADNKVNFTRLDTYMMMEETIKGVYTASHADLILFYKLSVSAAINYMQIQIDALKAKKIYTIMETHTDVMWNQDDPKWQQWQDIWMQIITHFKNEPYILGFEPVNEPDTMYHYESVKSPGDPDGYTVLRQKLMGFVERARQIDTRHALVLGCGGWDQLVAAKPVWEPLGFRPDPYDQAIFAFHCYPLAYKVNLLGKKGLNDSLDEIQDKYNVPLANTEWGDYEYGSMSTSERQQYQRDLLEACYAHRVPWSIWSYGLQSTRYMNFIPIWQPEAALHGTPAPAQGTAPSASRVVLESYPGNYIIGDGSALAAMRADICDMNGERLFNRTDTVTFSITSANASWEDGTTGPKNVNAVDGAALARLKTTAHAPITITASVPGLQAGAVTITAVGTPSKLVMSAQYAGINPGEYDLLTVDICDQWGNRVEAFNEGIVKFKVEGAGSIWVTLASKQDWRDIVEPGRTYVFLKSSAAASGTIKVTASMDGLEGTGVSVSLGGTIPNPDPVPAPVPVPGADTPWINTKVYPNPVSAGSGGRTVVFSGMPAAGTLSILSLSGRVVRSIPMNGQPQAVWDLKNAQGMGVYPGIYMYVIVNSQGNKYSGKLLVK